MILSTYCSLESLHFPLLVWFIPVYFAAIFISLCSLFSYEFHYQQSYEWWKTKAVELLRWYPDPPSLSTCSVGGALLVSVKLPTPQTVGSLYLWLFIFFFFQLYRFSCLIEVFYYHILMCWVVEEFRFLFIITISSTPCLLLVIGPNLVQV